MNTKAPSSAPTLGAAPPAGQPQGTGGFRNDIPRRVVEIPGQAPRRTPTSGSEGGQSTMNITPDMRKLIVGREISLSGEIAACDVLVVEGTVEAKLREGKVVEITDSGLFKGSVEIDDADIGGRFEGDITVRGTLRVRASGRIQGNVRYGVLEVEQGGQISGSIEVLTLNKGTVTRLPESRPAESRPETRPAEMVAAAPMGNASGLMQ